jgi:hypothetical protein
VLIGAPRSSPAGAVDAGRSPLESFVIIGSPTGSWPVLERRTVYGLVRIVLGIRRARRYGLTGALLAFGGVGDRDHR